MHTKAFPAPFFFTVYENNFSIKSYLTLNISIRIPHLSDCLFWFSTTIISGLLNRSQTYMETQCSYMVAENEKCKQTNTTCKRWWYAKRDIQSGITLDKKYFSYTVKDCLLRKNLKFSFGIWWTKKYMKIMKYMKIIDPQNFLPSIP